MNHPKLQDGLAHHNAGRLDQAEAIYRQVLAQRPHESDALHLLGLISHQRGDNATALQLLQQAIRLNPGVSNYHANLGLIFHGINRMPEAVAALVEAIRLDPFHADAWNNLGSAQKNLGHHDQALASFRRAIGQRPDFSLAQLNLALTLKEQSRLDEAVAAFRGAVLACPGDAAIEFRYALLLQEMGQLPAAAAHYRRVVELNPSAFEAHANLGNVLRDLAQIEPAIASYREAVRLRPDSAECHLNLASGLLSIGAVEDSLVESEHALRLKPDFEEAHTTRLLSMQYRVNAPEALLAAHLQWAKLQSSAAAPLYESSVAALDGGDGTARLRVGFVSPDYFDHPIAYFLEPLLAELDRSKIEVTCYSGVTRPDAFTQRIQASADRWREIAGLPHELVARLIVDDGIQILIDLTGHTTGCRLPVFALQPAPVQVSYLGYPSTTGLATIGYRLTDVLADPPGMTDAQYSETLVRLPRTLATYAPPRCALEVGELPATRAGSVTFGAFNSLAKIAPETIDLWAAVLKAVPQSRLVLMARGADGAEFEQRLRAAFKAAEVDPARIDLRPSATIEKYLAFHNEVDVVLDTFPFNGHTTLCHALWMGVPVVSLCGDRFAARLGLSVLSNVGLPQLVAETPEQFTQIAAKLVQDLAGLADLRGELREKMRNSALLDHPQFASDFEQALQQMWLAHTSGRTVVIDR